MRGKQRAKAAHVFGSSNLMDQVDVTDIHAPADMIPVCANLAEFERFGRLVAIFRR